MKKIILLLILISLVFISGCGNSEFSKDEFCVKEGYYQGSTFSNWEYAELLGTDFYCVDLERGKVSKKYTEDDLLFINNYLSNDNAMLYEACYRGCDKAFVNDDIFINCKNWCVEEYYKNG